MPENADDSDRPETPVGPDGGPPERARDDETAPDERPDLPTEVVAEAERLTRLARQAVDPGAAAAYRERRDELVTERGFTPRVREDDPGETLVLYPEEWVADGTIRPDRIEDTDRAAEVSLSGPGDPEEWQRVDEHNRELVAAVREDHGDAHGDNAAALADFAGNHYAKEIESLTAAELREFVDDYYRRNVWVPEERRSVVAESIRLVYEAAGVQAPPFES
jgi:hypothetical protein